MISFSNGNTFIVTGSASGLGAETSRLLLSLGARVVGVDLVDSQNISKNDNFFPERKDLTEDLNALPEYVKSLKEKYGKFSGLVVCAGRTLIQPLRSLDPAAVKCLFDLNFFAPVMLAKAVADKRNNIGAGTSIVFISSIERLIAEKGMIAYASAKAALTASAKCMAKELASAGIRVNSISPGDMVTPMTQAIPNFFDNRKDMFPLGFGHPADVSNLIAFLLSDKSSWITGKDYIIDGGCL